MPPKPIVTKEDIIKAAFQLVRVGGMDSINARDLAKALNCSTNPLFRIYKNMDELKDNIIVELNLFYNSYMDTIMTDENRLLSQGIAYIEFARKEKMLFNTLFMNKTMTGASLKNIINAEWNRKTIENIRKITELSLEKSEMVFIKVWLYSHGIATQIVANDIDISSDTVTELISDAFKRFTID